MQHGSPPNIHAYIQDVGGKYRVPDFYNVLNIFGNICAACNQCAAGTLIGWRELWHVTLFRFCSSTRDNVGQNACAERASMPDNQFRLSNPSAIVGFWQGERVCLLT
jgi:hypothetical protein